MMRIKKIGLGKDTAFTLVELLTVIAIIAVLATLLMVGVVSAKKMSKQAKCTSNLRQISIALNIFSQDFPQRARSFDQLVISKYLSNPAVLICPSDQTGNWGGIVLPQTIAESFLLDNPLIESADSEEFTGSELFPLPFSYLHSLVWDDRAWNKLHSVDKIAGFAICQLHGLGRPHPKSPSIKDYQGLILRALLNGSVIRRRIYWAEEPPRSDFETALAADRGFAPSLPSPLDGLPWNLFSDKSPEEFVN